MIRLVSRIALVPLAVLLMAAAPLVDPPPVGRSAQKTV